jgi:hypothetical protein
MRAGSAAEFAEALIAVSPHRVERVRQPEENGTRSAKQREPEERTENGVVAVLQRRFDARRRDAGAVEFFGLTRDHPADVPACRAKIALRQIIGDTPGMLAKAASAERQIEQDGVDQRAWQTGRHRQQEQQGDRDAWQKQQPAGQQTAQAAPFAGIQGTLAGTRQRPETDQRMPAPRLAEQSVEPGANDRRQGQQQRRWHFSSKQG